MLTQLPRYISTSKNNSTDTNRTPEFSQSVKQAYVHNQNEYKTFKSVADQCNDSERKKKLIPFGQKILNSQHILRRSYQTMHNTMVSIAQGNDVPVDNLQSLIFKLLEHLERHSDSVLYLSRQKRKTEYTYMRSVSFCVVLLDFVRKLGFSERDMLNIGIGALLHDAGKMWISKKILNKPGKLSREEFQEIKEHIKFSEMILNNNHITNPLSQQVSLQHHERLDGSGYPNGLKQEEISEIGQISAIVDVYDALTSVRCYQTPVEPSHALQYLMNHSGKKFNKEYVQRFVQHVGIYPIGSTVMLNNHIIGVVIERGRDLLNPIIKAVYDETTQRLIPPSKIVLEDAENLFITQTVPPSQLSFQPHRFIA